MCQYGNSKVNLTNSCFKYVVPFKFESDKYNILFNTLCDGSKTYEIDSLGKCNWDISKESVSTDNERDLYDYIRNEFAFENENIEKICSDKSSLGKKKIGYQWILKKNQVEKSIFRVIKKDKCIDVQKNEAMEGEHKKQAYFVIELAIKEISIYLFENGIGFFTYEIDFRGYSKVNNLYIKGLSNGRNSKAVLEKSETTIDAEIVVLLNHILSNVAIDENHSSNDFLYYKFESNEQVSGKNLNEAVIENTECFKKFYFTDLPNGLLSEIWEIAGIENSDFMYFSERVDKNDKNRIIPNSSISFSYCYVEDDGENNDEYRNLEREKFVFNMVNGNKGRYLFNLNKSNIHCDYLDTFCYASKVGVAYAAYGDAEWFSTGSFPFYFSKNCFVLFIKVLYQSYALLNFAERVQKEITFERVKILGTNASNKETEEVRTKALTLYNELQLFQATGMASSVSHLQHNNDFFAYLKRRLMIHEDMKSVSAGLDAIADFLKAKEEESTRNREKIRDKQEAEDREKARKIEEERYREEIRQREEARDKEDARYKEEIRQREEARDREEARYKEEIRQREEVRAKEEKAEKAAQEKAEKEAQEKTEKEAREKAEKAAQEKAEKEREKRINTSVAIISVFALISALQDGSDFIVKFVGRDDKWIHFPWETGFAKECQIGVQYVLFVILVCFVLKYGYRAIHNVFEPKDKEK